jgi:hypothetical protein
VCFERIGGLKPTLPLLKEIIKEIRGGGKKNSKINPPKVRRIKMQKSKMWNPPRAGFGAKQ